ncbi:ATP/GTP-binding protein [Acinetobacter sp. ME22]|uniref:GTP-binding protein n=1 Tax=Acinetobacter sp. ME22 TaxID=2904802 RepID=UPI001EDC3151|nr:ATP/GTP-binding protein [Acinetobacter sp. ME22]MCG2573255.1 ATP/GTP-binding protein [Acinetobacter sp. ME22]
MILQKYKIVFGGSMGSGKSSAIQSLSDIPVISTEAINTDLKSHQKALTTVGIDYGEVILEDESTIGLYGTPGQERFNFMWPILCRGAIGSIILIDHSKPDRLKDLEFYIQNFKNYTNNLVIGISHTDLYQEQLLKIYRDYMQLHHCYYPIFIVDAREKTDILMLVETLIANIEIELIA